MELERRGRVKRSHDRQPANRRTSMRATDTPFDWRGCLMGAG